ncbi:MAG: HlyD family efflux transporter periplasmic adaptor subunit [Candidatus Brocadiia bacterium]|nr:MAG: HlyD family efflux transporter periplasmic adaptor subunit [Candidatus Brocadiia bacterium]
MIEIGNRKFPSGRIQYRVLSVLVWCSAVAAVFFLLRLRSEKIQLLGFAQSKIHQVAANCDGRVKTISPQLFSPVKQGENIVVIDTVLDNEHLQAELATARAEVQRLMAQLEATKDAMLTNQANDESGDLEALRRFAVDVENVRLKILELKTIIETDKLLLRNLEVEMSITNKLFEEKAVAVYELQKIQGQYDALAKKVEENQNLQTQNHDDLAKAQQRYEEFTKLETRYPSVDTALEVTRKAVAVQELIVAELIAKTEPLVLKSPSTGIVSQILVSAGGTIQAGQPILTVAETDAADIVAYAREDRLNQIRQGISVEIIKQGRNIQVARSQVVSVGPVVELLPERLWRNPNISEWGMPLIIKVPPQMKLMPGELIGLLIL